MNNSTSTATGVKRLNKQQQQQQQQQQDSSHDGGTSPTDQQTKGLRMKIKRKSAAAGAANMGGAGGSGSVNKQDSTTTSSKHDSAGSGKSAVTSSFGADGSKMSASSSACEQRNNDGGSTNSTATSSSSSSSSSNLTTSTSKPAKPAPQPFERLKQAILEQEKSKQQSKQLKAAAASDKDKSKEQALSSCSGYANPFLRTTGATDGSLFGSSKQHAKCDPYEFNAKNEDRVSGGLPSNKKLKLDKVCEVRIGSHCMWSAFAQHHTHIINAPHYSGMYCRELWQALKGFFSTRGGGGVGGGL